MELGLKDRVVVVTGASKGIGLACVHAFAAEDAEQAKVDVGFEGDGDGLGVGGDRLSGDLERVLDSFGFELSKLLTTDLALCRLDEVCWAAAMMR